MLILGFVVIPVYTTQTHVFEICLKFLLSTCGLYFNTSYLHGIRIKIVQCVIPQPSCYIHSINLFLLTNKI